MDHAGFSVVLLILCGTVFVNSPVALIARLTPDSLNETFWIVVILVYYVLATLLPIDKLIGKLYPAFGVILIVMAVSVLGGIVFGGYTIPEITLKNLHPNGLPVWPFMFVTVACGAISGFHATQSPMIDKCITSEKQGRTVFYGAMIAESVIALIWAAAGVAFYGADGHTEQRDFYAGPVGNRIRDLQHHAGGSRRRAGGDWGGGLPDHQR